MNEGIGLDVLNLFEFPNIVVKLCTQEALYIFCIRDAKILVLYNTVLCDNTDIFIETRHLVRIAIHNQSRQPSTSQANFIVDLCTLKERKKDYSHTHSSEDFSRYSVAISRAGGSVG